jgi:hypothetical protein
MNVFNGQNAAARPHRAPGNLRVGGTFIKNANSQKINPRTGKPYGFRGPYMWVRVYAPDNLDRWGGVGKPPIIRIQFPGQNPVLAPISREQELNEGQLMDPYTIDQNPALGDADGRSQQEVNWVNTLADKALASINSAAPPGNQPVAAIRTLFDDGTGAIRYMNDFNTNYFIGWAGTYAKYVQGVYDAKQISYFSTTYWPKLYKQLMGEGTGLTAPLNQGNSGTNVQNAYLTASATIGAGEVLVITGKMPAIPRTLGGDKTMAPSEELRYWDLVLEGGGGGIGGANKLSLVGTIDILDEDAVLDANGNYFIAVGRWTDSGPPCQRNGRQGDCLANVERGQYDERAVAYALDRGDAVVA